MNVKVYETTYKSVKCITLENERMILKIIPDPGGKIQSIFDKSNNLEYLYQSPWDGYRTTGYGTSFLESDVSGFDDMFPTINPCFYQNKPWDGLALPDHGEVWSIPWQYQFSEKELCLSVHGIRLPYTLAKKLSFVEDNACLIEYRLVNHAPFPLKFIWAAHPLLNINEHSVIILPEAVDKIMNVLHGSNRLGEYGKIHNWPMTVGSDGTEYDMSKLNPGNRDNHKYYICGKMPSGECALLNRKTGNYLKLVFPVEKVPYLGIWVNENGPIIDQCNIAIEPCTGALDSIDIAGAFGQVSQVEAFGTYEWYLTIEIGKNQKRTVGETR